VGLVFSETTAEESDAGLGLEAGFGSGFFDGNSAKAADVSGDCTATTLVRVVRRLGEGGGASLLTVPAVGSGETLIPVVFPVGIFAVTFLMGANPAGFGVECEWKAHRNQVKVATTSKATHFFKNFWSNPCRPAKQKTL
jgi:hypothetical protein